MKLICGMPRSGTKYLLDVFHRFGKDMYPKIWCHNSGYYTPWSTNEAESISYAYYKGVVGYPLINLFSMLAEVLKYEKDDYCELMYKQPQLCFLRRELTFFSEIVICKRPLNSWVKSVSVYEHAKVYIEKSTRPFWLQKYEDRFDKSNEPYETLGKIWEENVNELIEFLEIRKMKYHVCEFGNVEHYKNLLKSFKLEDPKINESLSMWTGSKTDDQYKPFSPNQ